MPAMQGSARIIPSPLPRNSNPFDSPLAGMTARGYNQSVPLFCRATPILLVAALAFSARAGVVSPTAPLFTPPAGAWTGPLGIALADPAVSPFLPPGLDVTSLTSPEAMRAAAPLVYALSHSLAITPQALTTMDPAQRKAAIELAAEDAKETVQAKAYELAETARVLSKSSRPLDKEGRSELYAAVSQLTEMRQYYGPWLDEKGKAAVEAGYESAARKAWEVRTFLLRHDANPFVERAAKPALDAVIKPPYVLKPSGSAEKLRANMANNKTGWGQSDLDALYVGFGFVLREGGKHRMYYHPFFPQLTDAVSRQNDLPLGYVQSALKLIDKLEGLILEQNKIESAPATGPPATLTMADLSILLSPPTQKTIKLH